MGPEVWLEVRPSGLICVEWIKVTLNHMSRVYKDLFFSYCTRQVMFIVKTFESKGTKNDFYHHHLDTITHNLLVFAVDWIVPPPHCQIHMLKLQCDSI